MIVYIIRHGQSFNTHPLPNDPDPINPSLTPIGREQTLCLAERLRPLEVKRLVASPMVRTIETARILAGSLGLPVEVRPGIHEFREISGHICWGGRELAARYPDVVISPDLDPDDWYYGNQSRESANRRARSFLAWLGQEAAAEPDGRLAIVTHGAFTEITLGQLLRAGFDEMEQVVIDNTAVCALRFSAAGIVVLGINDTSHLAGRADLDPVAGITR